MKNKLFLIFLLGLILSFNAWSKDCPSSQISSSPKEIESVADLLSSKKKYLDFIEANSEQRQPLYLGSSPFEIETTSQKNGPLELAESYLELAKSQSALLAKLLKTNEVIFEIWPTVNDHGRRSWVFSRAKIPNDKWQWLDNSLIKAIEEKEDPDTGRVLPVLPYSWSLKKTQEWDSIFGNILDYKDLYQKPRFADCVFTDSEETSGVYGAWLASEKKSSEADSLSCRQQTEMICRDFPQPSRWNNKPLSIFLSVKNNKLKWEPAISWKKEFSVKETSAPRILPKAHELNFAWPQEWRKLYEKEINMFSGAIPLEVNNRKVNIVKRNSIQENNHLEQLVTYFEEQYRELGIKTERMNFEWEGVPQTNLIARIKGSLPSEKNRPIIIADHFDTAFEEDTFDKTGKRVASPGADDNYTATAGVLAAARYFQDANPGRDIWFVHLTGEEFPADDLGARMLAAKLLNHKKPVGAILLMDMIGFNPKHKINFQINSGSSVVSQRIAALSNELVDKAGLKLKADLLDRFDFNSYLYNTDGIVFDELGFPIVFYNEVMNRREYLRRGYHDTRDTVDYVDFDYAFEIVKLVTLTADALAHAP